MSAKGDRRVFVGALVLPELKRAIEARAAAEGRTVSRMVERLAAQALAARNADPGVTPPNAGSRP